MKSPLIFFLDLNFRINRWRYMHKIAALYFVGWVMSTSAITVEDYTVAEAAPSGLNWSYVYNYKTSSAVAVGGNWILTAKHVADDGGSGSLSVDGTIYNQQEIVYHDSADLALVRYDKAFPGHYSLYTGYLPTNNTQPKLEVLLVGYGTTGTVYPYHWTDNGQGRGTRRWGTQEIDRTATRIYDAGGGSTVNKGFWMDFDRDNTDYEAGSGRGDSGGGTFYNDGGEIWKLAGINVEREAFGFEYTATFAISMHDHADWIAETIPEPVATSLMAFGTFGLFLSRAKQRRKLAGKSLFPIRRKPMCDLFFAMAEGKDGGGILDNLTALKQMMKTRLLPVWSKVHMWYNELDKRFWSHMVDTHERKMARRNAIKSALKKKAINGFDTFLAHVMK